MMDKREEILLRLLEIMGTEECRTCGVDGAEAIAAEHVFRNRAAFEDTEAHDELPCSVLLDGGETTLTPNARGSASRLMLMTCQIFYVLSPRTANAGIGEELSGYRGKLIKAILNDGVLGDLLGVEQRSGYIEYRGIITDMQTGSSVEGQMQMDFAFAYVLNPNKL